MVKIYAIKILFFVFSVQLLFQETSSAGRILGVLKDYANLKDVDETLAFIYRNYRREQKLQRNVQNNKHKKEIPRNPHLQLHPIGPAHSTIYAKLFGTAERTASMQQQLAQLKISQKTSALIGKLFIQKIKEKENQEMENLGNVAEGEQSAVEEVEKLLVEDKKFMGEVKSHGFQLKGKQGLAVVLDDKKNESRQRNRAFGSS